MWQFPPPPPPPPPPPIKKGQVCILTLHHSISSNITQQIKLTAGKSLFDCWSLQKDSLCYYRWWCKALCPQMSVDILGTSCDQCLSMVQCCFTSTETVKLIRTESPGWPPWLSHNSWKCYYRLIYPCSLRSEATVKYHSKLLIHKLTKLWMFMTEMK